jgi:hypothetical protein
MPIFKYFVIVGAVLIAALWALSAQIEPFNLDAPAVLHSATTHSLPMLAPEAKGAIETEPAQPAAMISAPPTVHAARHHRTRVH